jgi:hypothetical protein
MVDEAFVLPYFGVPIAHHPALPALPFYFLATTKAFQGALLPALVTFLKQNLH